MLRCFVMLIALTVGFPGAGAAQDNGTQRYALLIGCTNYPNLEDRFHLVGPANDVQLCRKLLTERFNFEDANIVTLAEDIGGEQLLPTRDNIEREWLALAEKATPGDHVFILMAGHGTQAPIAENDESETDGLDEVFLPRDVGPWDDSVGEVENSIKDDEIREWIRGIQAKEANLWIVIDACHSGTMTRDAGDEIKREIRPEELGVPDSALQVAGTSSPPVGGNDAQLIPETEATRGIGSADEPITVALYAAQSIEPTIEKKLPRRGEDRKYYGLLTYTLNEILMQTPAQITYRELVQQVHRRYVQLGRVSPTPVLEGSGLDREVLGTEVLGDRPNLTINGNRFSGFKLSGGSLNGLTIGSILAVYPADITAANTEPTGYVRITDDGFTAIESKIEPCEYEGLPPLEKLESGMRCKLVYKHLGDQRMRIAVDPRTDDDQPVGADDLEVLNEDLEGFIEENEHLLANVAPEEADWLLRYNNLEDQDLFLTPAAGWQGKDEGALPPLFGPAPTTENEYFAWLNDSLIRIGRVKSLLGIAGGGTAWSDNSIIQAEIVRYENAQDQKGATVQYDDGVNLFSGDRVGFKVSNTGTEPQDVTILLIDSGYGIHVLYPTPGATNRLFPGNEVIKKGTITAETTGLEHLVVIAVTGKPVDAPANFAFLAQPTLERSRAMGGNNLSSPLGKVLQSALYGDGNTRGFAAAEVENYQVKTLSWQTHPER